jgi:DNA-directed RNA polymerase II subunit RPB2
MMRYNPMEIFCIPPKNFTEGFRQGTYSKLDLDGIIFPGQRVTGGESPDILVGKVMVPFKQCSSQSKFKDASLPLRNNETGTVDTVLVTKNEEGRKLVKIRTRSIRTPQIGDKFASRHGQKGTCGMTYKPEDMPFTVEGISPDIIVNPHAIPSRMTIGHLIECLASKVASFRGSNADGTAFTDVTVEDISKELHALGYQKHGNEVPPI